MNNSKLALTHQEALELLAFLLASAECCLREPPDYGPYRLISAAERLAEFWQPRVTGEISWLLDQLVLRTPSESAGRDQNPERFAVYLAECNRAIANVIKGHYESGTIPEN